MHRKTLSFDSNTVQAYNFLEKVRYKQSKLVATFIADFCKRYNITEETSYDELNDIVENYIKTGGNPDTVCKVNSIESIDNKLDDILGVLTSFNGLTPVVQNMQPTVEGDFTNPARNERKREGKGNRDRPKNNTEPIRQFQSKPAEQKANDVDDKAIDDMLDSFSALMT